MTVEEIFNNYFDNGRDFIGLKRQCLDFARHVKSIKCKEQRVLCADHAETELTPTSIRIDKGSISNTPEPEM